MSKSNDVPRQGKKSPLGMIRRAFSIVLFVFTLLVMVFTVFSVMNFNKESGKGFLGHKFFVVMSGSMKAEFKPGDVIISKAVSPGSVGEGDIITFRTSDPKNYDEIVTHKVKEKTVYNEKPAFVTYGTTTNTEDEYPALEEKVIGKYAFKISGAGYIFQFLKTPAGYFTLIFVPFLVIILLEGVRFFGLLRQYMKEQQLELDGQMAEIAEEKKKTQEMLQELAALKAQLDCQQLREGVKQ